MRDQQLRPQNARQTIGLSLHGHKRADWDFREKFASGFGGQPNATV